PRKVSTNDQYIGVTNLSTNCHFRRVYDSTGTELTADFDFIAYRNTSDMLLTTDLYNPAGEITNPTLLLKGHLPSIINIHTFKSDYIHPLKKGAKIEAGVKTSYVSNDNEVNYERMEGGKWEVDNRSNHFI